MKDYSKSALERSRPAGSAIETITFCLDGLYEDQAHSVQDEVVNGCTYEQLIGALLLAEDKLVNIARQE